MTDSVLAARHGWERLRLRLLMVAAVIALVGAGVVVTTGTAKREYREVYYRP